MESEKSEIRQLISLDYDRPIRDQYNVLHNRWHPDIPAVATVKQGEIFRVQCVEWTGGQIKNNDSADDVRDADLAQCHYLSGPIHVEGAEPGDYLEVEILEIQSIKGSEWGYTCIFDVNNGGGFLSDHFPTAAKAIWDFEGIYCTSRHIPGVRYVGMIHPGIMACAPTHELLQRWNRREWELVSTDPNRVPPLAFLPSDGSSLMGQLEKTPSIAREKSKEAARTVPPREHGGNVDIKNLSRGSKVWLPVYLHGAKLSVGDLHFSMGDGEVAFCGAIEMNGEITLRTKVIKGGVALHGNLNMPIYIPGPVEAHYSRYLTFEGISVDENGKQHYINANIAFREAVLNAIAYLTKFGYTAEQAYLLLSSAPCDGRINAIVDIPNACCTIGIPSEIFDFDVTPKEGGPKIRITTKCPVSKALTGPKK